MISIAMTTYNGSRYLREQINSILNQTINDFELIIVDDCSTDDTVAILEDFSALDNRILYFCNEYNMGFIKNFEIAILKCKGDFIALSDQDDIWLDTHLENLLSQIEDNYLICSDSILFNENSEYICSMKDTLNLDYIPINEKSFEFLLYNNYVQGSTCLFSRKLLDYIEIFPKNNGYFHDHWLAINAAYYSKIKYIHEKTIKYRQHNSNVTTNRKPNFFTLVSRTKNNQTNSKRLEALKIFSIQKHNNNNKYLEEAKKFYDRSSFFKVIRAVTLLCKNYKAIYATTKYKYLVSRVIKILIGIN